MNNRCIRFTHYNSYKTKNDENYTVNIDRIKPAWHLNTLQMCSNSDEIVNEDLDNNIPNEHVPMEGSKEVSCIDSTLQDSSQGVETIYEKTRTCQMDASRFGRPLKKPDLYGFCE